MSLLLTENDSFSSDKAPHTKLVLPGTALLSPNLHQAAHVFVAILQIQKSVLFIGSLDQQVVQLHPWTKGRNKLKRNFSLLGVW